MGGWRLTSLTLLSLVAAIHGRPSLLGSAIHGEYHGQHGQDHHGHHGADHEGQHGAGHHGEQGGSAVTVVNVEPAVLNADGSYSYRYDLSDGTFAFANGLAGGEITGGFGYKDTDGQDVAIDWVAGKAGFIPSGDHLGDGIGGIAQSLSYDYNYNEVSTGGDYNDVSTIGDYGDYAAEPYVHQEKAYVHNEIEAEPYVHEEVSAEVYSGEGEGNADKSFNFQFDGEEYNRQESADQQGTVQGQYSFIDGDGVERQVNYRAGAGIGFVPEADFFPVSPEVDAAFSSFGQKTASSPSNLAAHSIQAPSSLPGVSPNYYFEYAGNDGRRVEDGVDGVVTGSYAYKTNGGNNINVQYTAGSKTGFVIENAEELAAALEKAANEHAPVNAKPYSGEVAEVEFVGPVVDPATWEQDQSFKFGFAASDHSRNEQSDAEGNVRGSYNFRSENGEDIEVRYTAGAETGFVVENLDEVLAKSTPQESTQTGSASNSVVVQASLARNNVQSTKEFVAPSLSVEVPSGEYGAPSAPLPVSQPDTLYGAPPEDLPSYNEPEPLPVSQPDTLYGAPSEDLPSYSEVEAAASEPAPATTAPMMVMNPNYKFAYTNDDSSRTEDANPDTGIITGQYSYTNPQGNQIQVKYRAGADIGFVIENQEDLNAVILKATEDGAAAAVKSNAAAASSPGTSSADPLPIAASSPDSIISPFPQPGISYGAPVSQPETSYGVPAAAPLSQPDTLYGAPSESLPSYNDNIEAAASAPAPATAGMVMDASFNFAIQEDDHSFQEEADINGERTGSYSYTNPDGDQIEVRYRAGRNGFVILNPEDVLPKAPVHNV